MKKTFCTAIVLAAGSGKRMGTKIAKQYLEIDGKPLLYYTLLAFERSPRIDKIILTVGSEEQISYCQETILRPYGFQKVASVITGGKERYDSVWMGLKAVKDDLPKEATEGIVFIHDGARPFVTEELIQRGLDCAKEYQACAAGVPSKDTVKIIGEGKKVVSTPDRSHVWNVQTPQIFEYHLIKEAYEKANGGKITVEVQQSDSTTGITSAAEGSYKNIKITTPEDLEIGEIFARETYDKKK